jgi:thioredoxin
MNLKQEIRHGEVIIDFYAEWCGPCHAVAPVLDKVSLDTGIKIVKVDIDAEREISETFGVVSIPTMVYMINGDEQARVTGALPKDKLMAALGIIGT